MRRERARTRSSSPSTMIASTCGRTRALHSSPTSALVRPRVCWRRGRVFKSPWMPPTKRARSRCGAASNARVGKPCAKKFFRIMEAFSDEAPTRTGDRGEHFQSMASSRERSALLGRLLDDWRRALKSCNQNKDMRTAEKEADRLQAEKKRQFVSMMMKKIRQKSQRVVLICDTFRLKCMYTFSPKICTLRRGSPTRKPMDRWDRCWGCTLCVARKWAPRRARGEGRARPPLRQHPTPPRRRRRPRPHSRYQRHPREVRGGVPRRPAPNPSPRAEVVVSHSRASAAPSPVATPRSTSRRRRSPPPSRSSERGTLWLAWTRMA